MNRGGVFFARGRMEQCPFWGDPYKTVIIIHLLSEAAFKPHYTSGVYVEEGEYLVSTRTLAEDLRMDRKAMLRHLAELKKMGCITERVTKAGTVYSVPFREWILGKDGVSYTPLDTPQDPPQQPPPETPYIIKDNNGEKGFIEFWTTYPRKCGGMNAARKAYFSAVTCGATHESIMTALENCVNSREWLKDNGKFIPGPVKWFEQEIWRSYLRKEDEECENY